MPSESVINTAVVCYWAYEYASRRGLNYAVVTVDDGYLCVFWDSVSYMEAIISFDIMFHWMSDANKALDSYWEAR